MEKEMYDLTLSYIFTGNIDKAYTIINSIKKDELSFELIEKVEKLKALLNESCNLKNDRIPIYQRIEYEESE
jgi:Txe/YoeB family toxin of Txe-Axe toxin-antitoxin module